MITAVTIATQPGGHTIYDPRIAFVKLLLVDLEGTSYDIIRSTIIGPSISPSRRQVIYEPLQGFRFSGDVQFSPGATVLVLYKR